MYQGFHRQISWTGLTEFDTLIATTHGFSRVTPVTQKDPLILVSVDVIIVDAGTIIIHGRTLPRAPLGVVRALRLIDILGGILCDGEQRLSRIRTFLRP